LEEGKESYDFWRLLGGKMDYASADVLKDESFEPRLFLCSNASGTFKVEEIPDFSQEDLSKDDVMLLDAYSEVYVWVGSGSNDLEKKMAMETAIDYVHQAPDKRPTDTPIYRIIEGEEPIMFTAQFHAWEATKIPGAAKRDKPELVTELVQTYSKKYTYEQLLKKPYPPNVDASKLEVYLLPEEFEKAFGLSEELFYKLPSWKQLTFKKNAELF